jgi:hypothetical protein
VLIGTEHRSEVGRENTFVSEVILLVVVLGVPEALERLDARGKSPTAHPSREPRSAIARDLELGIIVREDQRCVLRLMCDPRRVMCRQREIDQLRVGDDRGIEVDLEALGLVAQITIGGIGMVAAGVADTRAPDSLDEPEPGIRSPESTDAKGGGRKRGGNL